MVRRALGEWEKVSGGKVKFKIVQTLNESQVNLDWKRVDNAEDYVHVGDKIRVRLIEIDKEKGRLKVSLRAMKEKPADWVDRPARPREDRPRRDYDRRDDRRRDDRPARSDESNGNSENQE